MTKSERTTKMTNLKRLLIVGAGNFGREVLGWALDVPSDKRDWEVGGFLDTRMSNLDGFEFPYKVLGDPFTYPLSDGDCLICTIGDPGERLRFCHRLKERGGLFATIIHPTAVIGYNCHIGEGCVLCPGAVITTNVTLGNYVIVNVHASVGHDAIIGDGCVLNGHADVTGWAVLGEGVLVGSHAVILPHSVVGDYAVVGAGSIVMREVEAHTTVFGIPAKRLEIPEKFRSKL